MHQLPAGSPPSATVSMVERACLERQLKALADVEATVARYHALAAGAPVYLVDEKMRRMPAGTRTAAKRPAALPTMILV